jgi:hypothetical protein
MRFQITLIHLGTQKTIVMKASSLAAVLKAIRSVYGSDIRATVVVS